MKIASLVLHAGYQSDPTTKSAAVPVYQTTNYAFDNTQHGADFFDLSVAGNIYTRIMNPTTAVLEQRLAAVEGGHWCSGCGFRHGGNNLRYSSFGRSRR